MIDCKKDFPFLLNDDVIYFDSASTTIKPVTVIDEVNSYLNHYPLTENRSNSKYTRNINKKINETKQLIKEFINANNSDEIFFTTGATDAVKIISSQFVFPFIQNNDEILLCREDHQSTISPFIELKNNLGKFNIDIVIKDILIDIYGDYLEQDLLEKVTDKTKFVILTHVHNIYGMEMNIEYLVSEIKKKNPSCKIILDASQSIGHINVDVQKLNIDFLFYSTHKIFGLTGCGVLYIKQETQKLFIKENIKIESGTQNTVAILAFKKSLEYINSIGMNKIESYLYELTRYLYDNLIKIPNIIFNKGIAFSKCALGYAIISFKLNNVPTNELAEILDEYNIVVRANNFCNNIDTDFIRISLHIYNTKEDIDKFIKILNHINS